MTRSAEETAALEIQESAAAAPQVNADGTVNLHLIRPCVGRGKGRHVYEADMLKKHAGVFGGWRMYVDHETDAERRARGGLPRSVKDLGGIVLESHWDENVPAEGRFGRGAVVGTVRPIKEVGELVALHPSLVESSINATATGVKPVMKDGSRAWLVEGIHDKGSVDWVTEGGAGGKVVSPLLEAAFDDTPEGQEFALFESMTDDEVRELIVAERPEVAAAIAEAAKKPAAADDGDAEDDGPDGDGGSDELEELVAGMVKKGMPRKMAMSAAKRQLAKSTQEGAATPPANEGDDDVKLTSEQIQEALASPEFKETLGELVSELVEAGIEQERTTIRAGAEAYAERKIELRDMRDTAHEQIREAALPAAFEEKLLSEFQVTSDGPTPALDIFEAVDDEGTVVSSLEDELKKVVEARITETRALVASVNPTRVRGQGATTPAGDGSGEQAKPDRVGGQTAALLTEANIDPEKYAEMMALRG